MALFDVNTVVSSETGEIITRDSSQKERDEREIQDQLSKGIITRDERGNLYLAARLLAIYRGIWHLSPEERGLLTKHYLLRTTVDNYLDKLYEDNGYFERLEINSKGNSVTIFYTNTNTALIERTRKDITAIFISIRIHKYTNTYIGVVQISRNEDFEANCPELFI